MSTIHQIEANRRNSEKSTGPTSVTGKAVASMNALKTGIHAKSLVLPSEKLADVEQLIDEYYQRHRPASPEARAFVDDLIRCEWTLRRLDTAETQMWLYQNDDKFRTPQKYPPAISQRGVRKRVKSLWERDFCVKRQGAHFCACFFRHFGHENP